jgi:hypothetical protein
MGCLQQNRRFSGIHSGVGKIQLGHCHTFESKTPIVPVTCYFVNGKRVGNTLFCVRDIAG